MPAPGATSQKCFGLLNRSTRWGLSRRGWLVVGCFLIGAAVGAALGVHPFLAITARVPSEVLVVEGWLPDRALEGAVAEFQARPYRTLVFVTGSHREYASKETADLREGAALERLRGFGLPGEKVVVVLGEGTDRDRTYSAACSLRSWAHQSQNGLKSFNVVTLGPHARRSRLLFQKAFGDLAAVGVIAVPNADYDAGVWWKYSEGARTVVAESIGYLYAKFFFFPES